MSKNILKKWIISKNEEEIYSALLLENNFKHAFLTRKSITSLQTNLGKENHFTKHSIHQLKQIHSNRIITCEEALKPPWPEGDALISSKGKKQILCIYTADCIPALFADKLTGRVMAIHSGWRGIVNNILIKSINTMERYGSKKSNIIVALGPAISGRNYEVSINLIKEIYNSINIDNFLVRKSQRENQIDRMFSLGIIKKGHCNKKVLLDIRLAAVKQLLNKGLKENQISVSKNCTFSEDSLFFSWRRTNKRLFQWSYIESK